MDYKVGSLADLISGKNTPNKTKVIQKSFIQIKKEPKQEIVEAELAKEKHIKKSNKKAEKKLKKTRILGVKIKKLPAKYKKTNRQVKEITKDDSIEANHPKYKKTDRQTQEVRENDSIKANHPKKSFSKQVPSDKNSLTKKHDKSAFKSTKKRKLGQSALEVVDKEAEDTNPKKPKLSTNQQNAAGRIKNKTNKENKQSGQYNDRTIFVGNIPINTTKEKIKKHFRKYGIIDSVRFRGIPVADPKTPKKVAAIKKEFHPDRNTIYAFIRFKSSEGAKKAEVENGELFLDHHLRVHCCELSDKPDESKAIFVGNLAFKAEEEELWNLFKTCGPISHVRIIRDGRTGMGKGFGYVNFKDTDGVQLALELEKVMLKDRELRISVCDSNRVKKRKLGKKAKSRNTKLDSKNQENKDEVVPKVKKFSKEKPVIKDAFVGTKFSDIKKKKKLSKETMGKKKLAKQLVEATSRTKISNS